MGNDPIPRPDISEDDPLSDLSNSVFQRRELLRPQYVPEGDRIVVRDLQMNEVEALLKPAAQGNPPENGFLFGETGTGKSLVAKHVTGRARAIAEMNDIEFVAAYVDCDQYDTETRVARELAYQAREKLAPNQRIPEDGIGASKYYDHLWGRRNGMLHEADSFVVILDEIDMLGDGAASVLSKLSRSEEAGKTNCYIGAIAISNKTDYTKEDDDRVSSSFQDEPIVFPPYDATQLHEILKRRKDAFREGVLQDGAIQLASAYAARDYGDARQALDVLRTAGKLADRTGSDIVSEDHVEKADEYVDLNRSLKVIKNATQHSRYALWALAYLTEHKSQNKFSTGEIYDVYKIIAETISGDSLSHQRILELLKEWSLPDITEHHHTGRGQGKGSAREHRLLHDPNIVLDAAIPSKEDSEEAYEILEEAQSF